MEEQITKSAGADAGEYLPVETIRALIEGGGTRSRRTHNHVWQGLARRGARNESTVLAGGVGAARFLRGLSSLLDPRRLTVIVNTGDDETFFGLHVSPDVDTVIYTLAGVVDPVPGLGRRATTRSRCLDALQRFYDATWFRLGDTDLATHIFRTDALRRGADVDRGHRDHRRAPRRARHACCR